MKKTINIHLGRQLFIIEEDAYTRLAAYLEKLRASFDDEKEADEIIEDIEMRCAEIIQNLLNEQKLSVVQLPQIEEVIASLGEPEEITDSTDSKSSQQRFESDRDYSKRLFRDMDSATIGGVCTGIAQYVNIDVTIIRILFVISMFLGFGVLLYLILWVVVPNIKTPSDRLQLKGKAVTVDSIKEEISRIANNKKSEFKQSSEKWKNSDHISSTVRNLIKIVAVCCGIGFVLFSVIWLIGFTLTVTGFLDVFPITINQRYATMYEYLSLVCANSGESLSLLWNSILITGFSLPLLGIVLGTRILLNKKNKPLMYALIGLPIIVAIGVVMLIVGSFRTARDFTNAPDKVTETKTFDLDSINIVQLESFQGKNKIRSSGFLNMERVEGKNIFENGIRLKTQASKDTLFHIYEVLSTHGIDDATSIKRSNKIKHEWSISGNNLAISPTYSYPVSDGLKNQSVELVIEVPIGKKLTINGNVINDLNKEHYGMYYGQEDYNFWDEDEDED